ncbi:hypothetical protein BpHYR1_010653 [Brachionus plicatilis]|uniref:Uncharacterized protein n=1 Tax=Brachionus plicatilis TaxID=10195 RepID=A0A3M7PAX6_BRAPC|nr:hypothetical protein BpHYR1_010653 [Brachionus plicatilis]
MAIDISIFIKLALQMKQLFLRLKRKYNKFIMLAASCFNQFCLKVHNAFIIPSKNQYLRGDI